MSTLIRSNISKRNKYYIPKHRYYELKHFCMQYPEFEKELQSITEIQSQKFSRVMNSKNVSDPTFDIVERRRHIKAKMSTIVETAFATDEELGIYILACVTKGVTYTYMQTMQDIPCCRETFYDRYRKFFWLLDKARD